MDEPASYDVFISYSHADGAWVHGWLLPQLEAAGLRVCIDQRDFTIGVPNIVNIERAVDQSRHTLLVLTPGWVASEWTGFQALLAQTYDPAGLRQRLLPLLLLSCKPPRHIGILTYADFTDPQQHAAQLQRVIETIQGQRRLADLGPALRTLHPSSNPPQDRNRNAMISKMRLTWVAGVLDRSVAKDARIALGLEARPDAVIDPVDLVVQRPHHAAQPLPTGTLIRDIYDQLGSTLLILGAPGAGKTTLLLELARDLLDRADQDPQHPIPVIFQLSAWAEERRPLEQWLVDELVQRYQVSRKLAQAWIDADAILPLLDGLDEVAELHRNACVEAINHYRQDHGLLPLVVCSRIADYNALTVKLRLHGAIVAQPLGREQVRSYLRAVGVAAIPSRTSPLWELLDTPLMLTVAALAYAGQPLAALPTNPVAARDQLFAVYIDRMFEHNNPQRPFTDVQTHHYLAYLAYQMQQHNQTTLYLEQMQPDWLLPVQRHRWPRLIRLIYGLIYGMFYGLLGSLLGGPVFGLACGLVYGLAYGLVSREQAVRNVDVLRWSWTSAWSGLRSSLEGALVFGLAFGLVFGLIGGLLTGLVSGVLVWLLASLLVGLDDGLSGTEIDTRQTPNEGIQRSGWNTLRSGLGSGLGSALIVGLIFGLFGGLDKGLLGGLLGGLTIGIIGGTIGVVVRAWDVALVFGLLVSLLGGVFFGLGSGLDSGLLAGLAFGVVIGLSRALDFGGRAYLQHYLIRLLLIRNGSLPRRLVPFLDYATQRIFLRRVGGGYIFIHGLLREHFAAQYTSPGAAP